MVATVVSPISAATERSDDPMHPGAGPASFRVIIGARLGSHSDLMYSPNRATDRTVREQRERGATPQTTMDMSFPIGGEDVKRGSSALPMNGHAHHLTNC